MVATATVVGVSLGLGTQLYSNAVRKLPLMRHPWEHLLAMGLGSLVANATVKWEDHLREDLYKILKDAENANKRRYIGCSSWDNMKLFSQYC
ncbi:hypothetical protein O6H91_18G084300 [Diphasiastrum complanatum]|uniref:Uncharacterized protein n=1 Tax=Diphasiastrum complanatum TaxID=34168 RepID=A0ACC2B3D4_DIPCM|nr:hypothetical protein O6H91_18G084300 [Diphasiastrum complanatum]